MEQLSYKIDDGVVAELLGRQNYATDDAAVLEIVKNAYDAFSKNLRIVFEKDCICFTDDGHGMDYNAIKEHWMYIGKTSRDYLVTDKEGEKRVTTGAKGLGRFALARLGKRVELCSCKAGQTGIRWITDWNKSTVDICCSCGVGTNIIVSELRSTWNKNKIEQLISYLENVFLDSDVMNITVSYFGISKSVRSISYEPKYGVNCRSSIALKFRSKDCKLYVEINSNEFDESAKKYLGNDKEYLYCFKKDVNVVAELSDAWDDCKDKLEQIGDFDALFMFNLRQRSKEAKEKFLYRYEQVTDAASPGILLYRNAFSISGLDGKKDWLELDKRARQSPAAATHPTGLWRVRSNQLTGMISIDKKRNQYLVDLSNRQGLVEDDFYKLFTGVILIGVSTFERYRQNIIRKIDRRNQSIRDKERNKAIEIFLKNPEEFLSFTKEQKQELMDGIKEYRDKAETEGKKIRYESQLLNMLATIGLKASSVAHEMRNDRNNLNVWCECIVNALKKFGVWDKLSAAENRKVSHRDVPGLIDNVYRIVNKVIVFMNSMLDDVQKKKFRRENKNVQKLLENVCYNWQRDYGRIQIELFVSQEFETTISEDSFIVIFDNLILNSLQQNSDKKDLKVVIRVKECGDDVLVSYSDNGRGLVDKYIHEPRRILEPNETSRSDGHGLGMWIVYNTILRNGGDVVNIGGSNGFVFDFLMKQS